MKEFDIIDTFFRKGGHKRKDVQLGIGDDSAIVSIPVGQFLAVTTDTLVSDVHFLANTAPADVAHKALAANLSDLAAMGAEPAWISLSLSMPEADLDWLNEFSNALCQLTEYYSIQLIGGDTVQGPLAVTITAQGFIPEKNAITRAGAKPGDWIFVTGTLGDAGVGLDIAKKQIAIPDPDNAYFLGRHNRPTPRVLAGTLLRRKANACIDLSDGLISDVKHIIEASDCGATIQVDKLPLSSAMKNNVSADSAFKYALSAGDDYELLFTVSEEHRGNLQVALANANVQVTCIGQMNGNSNNLTLKFEKEEYPFDASGHEHF